MREFAFINSFHTWLDYLVERKIFHAINYKLFSNRRIDNNSFGRLRLSTGYRRFIRKQIRCWSVRVKFVKFFVHIKVDCVLIKDLSLTMTLENQLSHIDATIYRMRKSGRKNDRRWEEKRVSIWLSNSDGFVANNGRKINQNSNLLMHNHNKNPSEVIQLLHTGWQRVKYDTVLLENCLVLNPFESHKFQLDEFIVNWI